MYVGGDAALKAPGGAAIGVVTPGTQVTVASTAQGVAKVEIEASAASGPATLRISLVSTIPRCGPRLYR